MTSRKIPKDYDNPLDNILIDLVEILNPYFKKLNFTPNGITFLSLVFGLITIVYFIKKRFIIAGMMFSTDNIYFYLRHATAYRLYGRIYHFA